MGRIQDSINGALGTTASLMLNKTLAENVGAARKSSDEAAENSKKAADSSKAAVINQLMNEGKEEVKQEETTPSVEEMQPVIKPVNTDLSITPTNMPRGERSRWRESTRGLADAVRPIRNTVLKDNNYATNQSVNSILKKINPDELDAFETRINNISIPKSGSGRQRVLKTKYVYLNNLFRYGKITYSEWEKHMNELATDKDITTDITEKKDGDK